jgi:hypothetical protein
MNRIAAALSLFVVLSASPGAAVSTQSGCSACSATADVPNGTIPGPGTSQVTLFFTAISDGDCLPKAQADGTFECKKQTRCVTRLVYSWNYGTGTADLNGVNRVKWCLTQKCPDPVITNCVEGDTSSKTADGGSFNIRHDCNSDLTAEIKITVLNEGQVNDFTTAACSMCEPS